MTLTPRHAENIPLAGPPSVSARLESRIGPQWFQPGLTLHVNDHPPAGADHRLNYSESQVHLAKLGESTGIVEGRSGGVAGW